MIKTTTFSMFIKKAPQNLLLGTLLFLTFITLVFSKTYAQQTKVYANTVSKVSPNFVVFPVLNFPTVENPDNAVSADLNDFARVKSNGGVVLGIGGYAGEIELKFPNTLPANQTSYLRIESNSDLLNALLGGTLGGLIADIGGSIILGNHYFDFGARNSTGNAVLTGTTLFPLSDPRIKLVRDGDGFFYLAITPNQPYDRIYFIDRTSSLLLSIENSSNVYYAFTYSGTDNCAQSLYTSFDAAGLSASVIGLNNTGVDNPQNAIDADPNNFSSLKLGLVGVLSSVNQDFYFTSLSSTSDAFNVRFSVAPALISAGLFNNLTVTAFNDSQQVFSAPLGSLISLDVLGLFNSGNPITVPITPGVQFNRVRVSLGNLVNLSLSQAVNLYGVTRTAGAPTFATPLTNTFNVCYNSSAALKATTANTNELIWYDVPDGGTALATTAFDGTFNTPNLTANKTYYVAARKIGCTLESGRVLANVVVNPQIVFNGETLNTATVGFSYSRQLAAATGGTPGFTYALASGSTLPSGLTLSSSGLVSGTPTATGNPTFDVVVTDSKGCTKTATITLNVTPALTLAGSTLPDGTVGTVYPTQTIPAATGGTGPYSYTSGPLPAGLVFNPTTREISGTPTAAGTTVVPITVTDANGNTVTTNYTIKVTDPLVLPPATLASGVTGTVYPTQTIPAATGGTGPYTYVATGLPPGLSFDPATRQVTGTPTTAGTYPVSVTVTDADGKTATNTYPISVTDPLVLPAQTLPDGTVGASYPAQTLPGASGGVGPYTYSATGVPAGLSFNPATRQITGTPTTAGGNTITLTATDSQGRTASNTYNLNITGVVTLPTASLPNGTVGTVYPAQTLPGASGGVGPYTYTATGLPPGLTFDPATRTVSGTPTTGGPYTVSVTATDSNGNKATTVYPITVDVTAPTVSSVSVCPGNPATLTVSNVQSGVSYNLYGPTGSTPISTNTTGVFVVSGVTATTTYSIEAVSGGATSSKTPVTVTVNPPATAANITTASQTINAGQSTTLGATADAGNSIAWFDAATGGTQVGTGTTFTTPVLNATTTYYVETTNAQGCPSASRVAVTVTVISNGGGTSCNAANAQNSGITGICLLCGINGAGNSTDSDPNNTTRINLTVGAGATGYQQLIFQSAGLATDSIKVDLGIPTGLLDVSLLNNITLRVLNGSTVVKTVTINSSLLNLNILGGNRFTATVLAGGVYDRVEVSYGALVSALSSLDIYGATVVYPAPTITAGNQSICSGSTATLTATANGGTNLAWFSAATGGTQVGTGGSFTTPALTATTTYYIEVRKGTCPSGSRIPVIVTVNPAIVFNNSTLTNATIGSSYSKQIPVATGGTPGFTYALASGSTLPSGLTLSSSGLVSGTPTATGNPTFDVVVTDSKGCTKTATITLNVTPALTLAGSTLPDGTVGTVYPTQTIPAATGGTGPYSYTSGPLPAGLVFNPTTREISGTPTAAGTTVVPITVTDANGNTVTTNYTIKVTDPLVLPPATLASGVTGTVYPTQTIPAATGGTGPYTYVATGLPPGLSFDPATRQVTGTPTTAGTYPVSVTVTDASGRTATGTYPIKVTDPLVLPPATLANGITGTPYPTQTIPSAIGGTAPYSYVATGLPPGLSFNPATRQITGTPTTAGNYTTTVTVTDADGKTANNTYAIAVMNPLVLPAATLPDATEGTAYPAQTLPAAVGGMGPYTYVANNVPPGLTFNPTTRQISGTPTQAGNYLIDLTATDSQGNTASNSYALKVIGVVTLPTATLPNGTVGTPYPTQTLPAASGGTGPYTYTATGLPPGLTFDPATRTVSGTPTTGGPYTVSVTATDASGNKSTTDYPITINVPAPIVASVSSCSGSTATLTVGNVISGVTYNLYGPTGSSPIATNTTGIFTTPVLNSTTNFSIEAVSGTAVSAKTVATVTVNPTIIFNNATLTNATIGSAYSKQIPAATGGTGGFTYAVASGSTLPSGLSLSTSGLVSGTPTGLGNPTFNVVATDGQGCTNTATITLSVTPALTLPATTLPDGTTGVPYPPQTIPAATGGTGPYTYAAGTLPPGLTFDPITRIISGTPTTPGNYIVPITVTDANGNTVTTNYPIAIADPLVLPPATLANGVTGAPYAPQTIPSAIGGKGPYNYTANNLPPGLSFDPITRQITGTPTTTGNYPVVVVVTDAAGRTATNTYNISVTDPLLLPAATLPNGTANAIYPAQTLPSATGGVGPYTYAASGIPAGLVFDPISRQISGTPTTPGDYVINLTATDSQGKTASNTYNLKINPPLSLPTASLPNGTLGVPYPPQTLPAATGGTGPYNYTATGLPPGLTFDPVTRTITGTPTQGGTFPVTVTVTDGNGNTTTTVYTITIGVDAPVVAGVTICSGNTATLTVSNLKSGVTYNLYGSTGTVPIATNNTGIFVTPIVTSTTMFFIEGVSGTAASSKTPVTVTVNPSATSADIILSGIPVSACSGSSVTLTASSNTVNNPIFTWYANPSLTSPVFTGPIFTIPVLNAATTYYVTVRGDNRCENSAASARLAVIPVTIAPSNPVVNNAGTNICAGDATTLTISNPEAGATYDWYSTASGGSILFTGTAFTTPALNLATDYYVVASSSGGCTNTGGRIKVTVTVNAKPITPTVSASSVNTCIGSSATLSVTNPQSGVTYNWFTSSTGGSPVATGTSFNTPTITANITYYVEGASGSCTSAARTSVNVTASTVPTAPSSVSSSANGDICAGSTTTLSVNNPVSGVIYRWYTVSSGGTLVFEGNNFTTPALTASTTYYVESVGTGGCSSSSRTAITVNALPKLASPVVRVQSTTNNSVTFAWAAVDGASSYDVSLDNGTTFTNQGSTSYTVNGLKPDQSVSIVVRAKGTLDCQTSANAAPLTGTAANPFGNDVYIPNAFTPNNDGKNDTFLIYGNTIATVKLKVYTQWGQMIFQSDNAANGWDGTFKGVNQPIGVYVYMADITYKDGTTALKKGTITLIR